MAARRHDRQADALTELAPARELAVLGDGPWAPRWYWRDDLEAMQAAAARMGHAPTDPPGELRGYAPTGEFRDHPGGLGAGRVWRYRSAVAGQRGQGQQQGRSQEVA